MIWAGLGWPWPFPKRRDPILKMPSIVIISLDAFGSDTVSALARDLLDRCLAVPGCRVVQVPPLYHLAEDSSLWEQIRSLEGRRIVVSDLYPRPLEWLLRRHGAADGELVCLDARAYSSVEECFAAIQEALGKERQSAADEVRPRWLEEPVAPRWYPIIDGSRCRNCHQCFQFCLFGVYALDAEGKVAVTRPDKCKPGCAACSRICPAGAIMFPLYEKDKAIAGAPGATMTPDPAGRRLYYQRTGLECPACGRTTHSGRRPDPTEKCCPECGGVLPADRSETEIGGKSHSEVCDEIDGLIARLDRLAEGGLE